MKLNITKGEWGRVKHASMNIAAEGRLIANTGGYYTNADNGEHIQENNDNAELIINAGNAYQKCGMLPSELLKVNQELLSVSDDCRDLTKDLIEDRKELLSALEKFTPLNENAPEFRCIAGLILHARAIVQKAKQR